VAHQTNVAQLIYGQHQQSTSNLYPTLPPQEKKIELKVKEDSLTATYEYKSTRKTDFSTSTNFSSDYHSIGTTSTTIVNTFIVTITHPIQPSQRSLPTAEFTKTPYAARPVIIQSPTATSLKL